MNIAHATISGTMKVPKARGIGMTTGCEAVGVKPRLSHRIRDICCRTRLLNTGFMPRVDAARESQARKET
jgi:hypothetical protein